MDCQVVVSGGNFVSVHEKKRLVGCQRLLTTVRLPDSVITVIEIVLETEMHLKRIDKFNLQNVITSTLFDLHSENMPGSVVVS